MNALWLPWNLLYISLYEAAKRRVYYWQLGRLPGAVTHTQVWWCGGGAAALWCCVAGGLGRWSRVMACGCDVLALCCLAHINP